MPLYPTAQLANINNVQYQDDDIQRALLNKIEESRQQFPEHYSKPIYVLNTVHDNVQNQFQSCLQQAKQAHRGERILLIPCQVENSRWTGICLEFNANDSVARAVYIDPMTGIGTVPVGLQQQFTTTYPFDVLQLKNFEMSDDLTDSAKLTVKNLLTAANIKLPIVNNGLNNKTGEGNEHKICELQEKLNTGLEKYKLQDIKELESEIEDTNELIQKYQSRGKKDKAQEKIEFLHELEELKRVSDEISILMTEISSVDVIDDLSTEVVLRVSSVVPQGMTPDEQSRKRSHIRELRHDSVSMPECVEKTAMELLAHFEEQLLEERTSLEEKNTDISLLEKLRNQVKRDKLLSDNSKAVLNPLETHAASNNYLSIVNCLNRFLKTIRPLNVLEIERLISKANQAAELIRDKDIVLLIGQTGSGKSTTIQFLAGCRMIETKVELAPEKFLPHITTDRSINNPQLNSVISSPFNRSETRYITPVTVELRDIIGPSETGVIILCDGPGFSDTAGPEVDIANSVGVIEALRQTKSVKLLVLSSHDTLGGRGEGIRKLAHILINMVNAINDRLHGIFYAFTKYSQEISVNSLLIDIKTSQVDVDPILQSDEAFQAVLSDMIEKSEDPCCKIDPIRSSPRDLLIKLKKMKGIQNPSEVFSFPMNDETRNTIDKHIQRDRGRIDYGIKHKDDKLLAYYLKDFKTLVDLIQKDYVRQAYEESVRSISESINEYCNEEIKKFNRLIASQDGLKEEDIGDYKASVEYIRQIQIIRENLEPSLSPSSTLIQNIITQLEHRKNILKDEDLHSPLIGIYLDNFLMLKTTFNELETDYNSRCKEFEKRFDDLVESARDTILTNDFTVITQIFVKISKSIDILQKHFDQPVHKKYNDTVKALLRHLSKFSDKVESILVKITLTDDDIKVLTNDIEILRSAKENYALREHISKYIEMLKKKFELTEQYNTSHICEEYSKDFDEIYDEYIAKIIARVDEINERIKVVLDKNEEHALEDIEKFVNDIDIIRKIPEIELKTVRTYYKTVENISNHMQQLQQVTQNLLHNIDQQSGSINDRRLIRLFSSLKNTKWINKISPGIYDTSYIRLREELIEYAQQLENRFRKLDLSLKCPDNVCVAQGIIEKIDHLCSLQQDVPELEGYQKKILQHFLKHVKRVFRTIREDFVFPAETLSPEDRESHEPSQDNTFEDSESDISARDYVLVSESNNQKVVRETIGNDKRAFREFITKFNTYVEQYNQILDSRRHYKITRFFVPSKKENMEAARAYLEGIGFHSIEALKATIEKFEIELKQMEEDERCLFLASHCMNSMSKNTPKVRAKLVAKREKSKPSDKLRLSEANDTLIYVRHCEKIRDDRVKQISTNIYEILQNYLDKYVTSLIEQKIMENFKRIIRIDEDVDRDLLQYAQDLEIGLRELFSLRKFDDVFQCIDGNEKLEHCKQEFLKYFDVLNIRMEEYTTVGRSQQLNDDLLIAQALSCVDRFCGIAFESGGYGALYKKYRIELIKGCKEAYRAVLDCIGRGDYANVALELSHIDTQLLNNKALAQIKHDLQRFLNKLMNDTEYSSNYLDGKIENEENNRNQIKEIIDNIETVQIVLNKENITELLDDKTKRRLQNFNEKIDQILSASLLTALSSIEGFINNENFLEAEKDMEIFNRLQRELRGFCTSEDVIRKSKTMTERLNDIVTEILKQNDFSDVLSYSVNPPTKILTKLEMTASHYGQKYSKAYKDMLMIIIKNFTSAIESARILPLPERVIKIRSLDHALEFLPDELRESLKQQLNGLKHIMVEEEKNCRQELDACFINMDDDEHTIERIKVLADQLKNHKLHELLNQLRNQTLKRLYICRTNLRIALDQQDIQLVVDIMEKVFKYKVYLGSYIVEIKEICDSVRVLASKGFINCCKTVADISSIEETQIVEKAFSDIVIYLDSSETVDKNIEILLSENVLQYAREELQKMFQYLYNNSQNFRDALNDMNIVDIHRIIVITQKWNRFLEKLKQCRVRHILLQELLITGKSILLYRDMISELENLVNHLKTQIQIELINNDTIKFEIKRHELHSNIMTSIRMLKTIDSKLKDILPSMFDVNELERNLQEKVQRIFTQLLDKVAKEELSVKDTDDFRMYYNHLVSFEKYVHLPGVDIRQILETTEEKIFDRVISLRKEMTANNVLVSDVAQILIKMKFLAENLSMFDRKMNAEIDEGLKILKEKRGMFYHMELVVILENSDLGRRLINEHSCLTGESWKRRRDKMQKQDDIEYILKELNGDDISKEKLRTRYNTFREKYDELISNNLKLLNSSIDKEPDVKGLVAQIKFLVGSLIHPSKSITWNGAFIDDIPQLLAYIFAVWTLKNTQHYNTTRGLETAQSYLLMPHVGQVIAVFRLLGIGYSFQATTVGGYNRPLSGKISNSLVNNLVEIGTGEGKSVVMAITACVFALTGIDVNCSCYSEVLSTRDQNEFAFVFRVLGVEERIKYGTFDRLCEQFLNEQCNVRGKVRNMIVTNQNMLAAIDLTTRTRPRILLIDEVDVFLSDQFYGGMYNPAVILNEPPIKMLFDAIWQNKALKTLNDIRALPAYESCAVQYSNWIFLFDEAIKDMLADLQSFKMSKHIVRNDKICYVKGESVVDNIIHRYNTMWAYYQEHEKGNITTDSLQTNVGIIVHCGTFSYAEMPHDFAYIAGVTGTLRTLVRSEEDILKNVYAVHKKAIMPSVFGKSNRTYNPTTDVYVVVDSEYLARIRAEIDLIRNAGRAILVFFKSEEELMTFFESSELSLIKEDVQIVTERVDVKDRELYIKRASTVGKVTLLTRIFGRGTDFVCDNREILEHGGIHVLQTFFSKELSEEYQIMGRAARQGDQGSYSMILLDKDLEWVLGSTWKDELANIVSTQLYETINKARNALYESKCGAKDLSIEQCKREHKLSKDFMNALSKGDTKFIKSFLNNRNKGVDIAQYSSRTILLLSGTTSVSMSAWLSVIKETVDVIFERASFILKEKGLPSDVIHMQIVIERNDYRTQNRILQVSSWYRRAGTLRAFLDTMGRGNNWPDDTIQTGLRHALRESEKLESISQVILIGDSLASNGEQVKSSRDSLYETHRETTTFARSTYHVSELEKLRAKHIPVHTFYLNSVAEAGFREIANKTGGRCMGRRSCSSHDGELLTNFITQEVIQKAAGAGGDVAVEMYRTKYVRRNFT